MSDIQPFFSIIVPVYNTENLVRGCIESLLAQSFQDFEIIAVDDGSTDSSGDILHQLALRDRRVRIFSKPNGGQGSARNLGLSEARGSYVGFVDSDDTVSPDLTQTAHSAINDGHVDVVCFAVAFVNIDGRTVATRGPATDISASGESIFIDAMLDRNFHSVVWNKFYRRSLLLDHDIRFPELRAYEDTIFSRHVALHAETVIYLKRVLYFALTRSGSTSRGMTVSSFVRAAEMIDLEQSLFDSQFDNPAVRNAFRAHLAHFLAYLTVLAAFRIDDPEERAACRQIADDAGFRHCATDREALAVLGKKARLQIYLAQHPRLLRAAAVAARRLGFVPY